MRTPTILQREASDCGAAALGMVLAFHGRWVAQEALRIDCGVSRDGARAGNLLRAARLHGMEARGFRVDAAEVRHMPLPAILLVDLDHFLVLEGFGRDGSARLNDPASGRRRVPAEAFESMYSGIVLTFVPGPGFAAGGMPPRPLARLASWLHGRRRDAALIVAASLALTLFALIVPGFSRVFIDHYLVDGQAHWVPWLIAVIILAALLQGGLIWLRGTLRQRLLAAIETRIAAGFVWRLLRLPMAFHARRMPGSLASRVALAPAAARQAVALGTVLLVEGGSAALFLAAMIGYSPLLATVAAGGAAVSLLAFLAARDRLEEMGRQAARVSTRLSARTMLGLQMIESLKAGGAEAGYFTAWAGEHARLATQQQRIARLEAWLATLPAVLGQFAAALVLVLGGLLVMRGELSFGMLVAFQLLHAAFGGPVQALLEAGLVLQEARGGIEQLDEVLAHPAAREFEAPAEGGGRLLGRLGLRGIAFGYGPKEAPLVEGFDLDVAPGSRVALVGASGSGKTTIGRLASGLLEPWRGEVLLDGRPIQDLPRATLRRSLAVVDQEIVLFEGTLRDNIALWDETLPDSTIQAAALDAEIHEAIMARGGYGAAVAEGGRNFSGGQRQRIEIARALATDPAVLVLDEATSALDPLVEQRVMANLRRRGCTCLIVAHRLSTIRDCDEIIVLDKGRVLERGDHATLMARRGAYAALIEA